MQRLHYAEALERAEVLAKLSAFDPHIVGTPPLGLELPESDIDVLCFAPDADAFARAVWDAFSMRQGFRVWQWIGSDRPVVATFADAGWTIEVFGQARPIPEQSGWRHFIVERRLLAFGGEAFRLAVLARRHDGMKTEPAFAAVLGLTGDPYEALFSLEARPDAELTSLLTDRGFGEGFASSPR